MDSTVCVLYLHNEVLLKIIMISIHTYLFFLFLRNKENRVCFHWYMLFYSSELFVILNRNHNNNIAISQLIMLERKFFLPLIAYTHSNNSSVYTFHLIKNTVCKNMDKHFPQSQKFCFHGQNGTWAAGLKISVF